MTGAPVTVAVVGAGPRAVGLVERLGASRPELLGDRPLDVHLVDPYPVGSGRVWRTDQSALLTSNTAAGNVTMFTDQSATCAGPVRSGPTLARWAGIEAEDFATRATQGRYLSWVWERAVAQLGPAARVRVHPTRARALSGDRRGRQRLYLDGRTEPLLADVVVLAVGHLDAELDPEQVRLRDFAARYDLTYLPPGNPADADLALLAPGEPVLTRGLGLTFVDLMVLVTEGRGGEYRRDDGGVLRYRPSGREPRLMVGSRRGVPHLAKFGYRLAGEPPTLPRFFEAGALPDAERPLDFRTEVWPAMAKELGWGYYHELFTAHPDRTALPFAEFTDRYAALDWYSAERVELVRRAVPDRGDVLDLARLDRPLRRVRARSLTELQPYLHRWLDRSARRRGDPARSSDLGALLAAMSVWGELDRLASAGRLSVESVRTGVHGWWPGLLGHLATGPPAYRLEQLRAAADAGVVSFLGERMWVSPDDRRRSYRAGSATTPETVEARALVEARLPTAAPDRFADPLLHALQDAGDIVPAVVDCGGVPVPTGRLRVDPADSRIVDRTGATHPRRFALGPYTDGRHAMAFAPPAVDAPTFRHNDAAARAILDELRRSS
ncbi:FAD/NAD(P)-binding protein [Plantactinospora mayteni]|uniref:Adenylate cyclase n=1 Tax=Plantactinospora mayteni TaxID=566021 RepID=A0ABQ4EPA9_9ACTN|nr:FAD/NAD(P)-binding protein [Plantactinospora mayteni]GIG96508.1 adenylate cyclase [Plantactinospora mayteni]